MKKIIALAATMIAAVSLASAEITVGARGIFGLGVGTTVEDPFDLDMGKSLDFGFAAFAKIPVADAIGIQPELGFTHNTIGIKYGSFKGSAAYNAIDIPVLVTYDLELADGFTLTPELGPKLSIPVGDISFGGDLSGSDSIDSKVLFGIVAGVNAAYEVGPGALVGDIRYDLGLSKLKGKTMDDLATPRALLFSIGYQMKF